MNRRDFLKSTIAAIGLVAAAPVLAAVDPLASMVTPARTFYVSQLLDMAMKEQNKSVENIMNGMFIARWMQGYLRMFRDANPETYITIVIDVWRSGMNNMPVTPGGTGIMYIANRIILIERDGRQRVIKDRDRVTPYYL